ncbi:hypothetical protein M427DRAFT_33865 [Gonapodya prolifera JEL478]|uniref:Uncharacterized protein n=1 Tax=Gonapodya prolifera (strain JEL478) TaxID=1344416 RepID=A0A139A9X0_GONPJ|nr:hypothetical protein M427DRAFT_33865 [Gonapodya prolifera JEL478]|eukprot:KXS13454.1 hypothetical protein M427DRAFT_33865 [Gonapodya prolifera JEL478]
MVDNDGSASTQRHAEAPTVRAHRRRNGLSLPWTLRQIVSLITTAGSAAGFFGHFCTVAKLGDATTATAFTGGILFLLLTVSMLFLILFDPKDKSPNASKITPLEGISVSSHSDLDTLHDFPSTKRRCVSAIIRRAFCPSHAHAVVYPAIIGSPRPRTPATKYCRLCNLPVAFLVVIFSGSCYFLVCSGTALSTITTSPNSVAEVCFVVAYTFLSLSASTFLLYLVAFHIRLWYYGMTTLQYSRMRREQRAAKAMALAKQGDADNLNTVSPQIEATTASSGVPE